MPTKQKRAIVITVPKGEKAPPGFTFIRTFRSGDKYYKELPAEQAAQHAAQSAAEEGIEELIKGFESLGLQPSVVDNLADIMAGLAIGGRRRSRKSRRAQKRNRRRSTRRQRRSV
jgi:hypothetical protein